MYLLAALAPLVILLLIGREAGRGSRASIASELALGTGLVALSLLVVALVLPARIRSLSTSFGIEAVLRSHRFVALFAVVLVVLHVVLVVVSDPRGLRIFDLRTASAPVWAATTSTVALGALVGLALRRRRRRPRYEGWRLGHVALAALVLVSAAAHVWWLESLAGHPWMRAWFAVLALVAAVVAARRWLWRPLRAHRRTYVVEEVRPVSGDAVTVVVAAHGHGGLPFRAGQFAWLKIGTSPFVFEEHPFTIASTAERPHRKEFTIKALGDFTELLSGLKPGRKVYLDGPYGGFTTDGLRASGYVFLAGGVGITPMLSILRTLADRGDDARHHLLVGGRTPEDLVARAEIEALSRRLDLSVTEVVEQAPPGWTGPTGRISHELLDEVLPPSARRAHYFLCGPPPMVVAVGRLLRERGVPAHHVHTEQFEVV